MKKNIKIISILLTLVMVLTACSSNKNAMVKGYKKYNDAFFDTFDTEVKLEIHAKSDEEFEKYKEIVRNDFERYHGLFNTFDDYKEANLKTVNENAGKEPVKVSEEIMDLLEYSMDLISTYGDKTNIGFGSVLKIWHSHMEEGRDNPEKASLPDMKELEEAKTHASLENLVLDEENSTVFLKDEKMQLDVGAIAKGYAAEKAINHIESAGCESAIISAGGNIKTLGKPKIKGRAKWGIGLENPDFRREEGQDQILDVVYGTDISVVTSGDYQRFYTVDGKNYHHIIDPETLMPADYYKDVTVITKDSGFADFLSTTVFLMPLEEGKKFVESLDGVEAMWVDKNKNIIYTEGMKSYLKSEGASADK